MQKTSALLVRLDARAMALVQAAAKLRQVSVSDYVRTVIVEQAARDVAEAQKQPIAMTPEEQLLFYNALSQPPKLTKAQKELGKIMRGEA